MSLDVGPCSMFLAHPPSSTPAASSLYITSVPVRVCVVLLSCYPFSRFRLSLSYGLFSSVNFRFLFNLVSASTFLSLQPLGRSSIHHTPLRLFLHLKNPPNHQTTSCTPRLFSLPLCWLLPRLASARRARFRPSSRPWASSATRVRPPPSLARPPASCLREPTLAPR